MITLRIQEDPETLENMISALNRLASASVDVGLVGSGAGMADRAALLEHGSPAMGVPSRPFFHNAVSDAETVRAVADGFGAAIEAALAGDEGAMEAALEEAGKAGADGIRAFMDKGLSPPNAPITVSGGWMRNRVSGKPVYIPGKGFNRPGYDTGALYESFTFEVHL